jgi:hypothetical protein
MEKGLVVEYLTKKLPVARSPLNSRSIALLISILIVMPRVRFLSRSIAPSQVVILTGCEEENPKTSIIKRVLGFSVLFWAIEL